MKLPLCLRIVAIVLSLATCVDAQQPPSAPGPTSTSKPQQTPKWNIRAEGFAVIIPQEKALAMLPEMLDETKIDAAYAKIMEGIQNKDFTLAAYQIALTTDGETTGTAETIVEQIYPTQFEPPSVPQTVSGATTPTATASPAASLATVEVLAVPTAFEKRNTGITLEVQVAQVTADGRRISAYIQFQDVSVIKWDAYDSAKTTSGKLVKVQQPRFFVAKSDASTTFTNGCFALVGVHKLEKPAGSMGIYLVRITATPREH